MHDTSREIGNKFIELYCQADYQKILDIGSMNIGGSLKDYCPSTVEYTGVDIEAGEGVDIVLDDPYLFPFKEKSFDIIVTSSTFEHNQMFWLTFCEMSRVLKDGGYMYINAPSNGAFHQYPYDNWRFYPDAGVALEKWANRNGYQINIVESFISFRKSDLWNDFVMIFQRGKYIRQRPYLYELLDHSVMNVRRWDRSSVDKFSELTEDMLLLKNHREKIDDCEKKIDSYREKIDDYEKIIEDLYLSKSWRITAPLRTFRRYLRRMGIT